MLAFHPSIGQRPFNLGRYMPQDNEYGPEQRPALRCLESLKGLEASWESQVCVVNTPAVVCIPQMGLQNPGVSSDIIPYLESDQISNRI